MAQINILKPKYGTITVLSTDLSNYTVFYNPPDPSVEFTGWKVFCHACGQYLYTAGSNPASFNIQRLLDTGHPGPFDISAGMKAEVEFHLTTRPDDPNMGSTSPEDKWIDGQLGQEITYTIKAVANEGYVFEKWVSDTGNEYTTASVNISVTLNVDDGRSYVAYFRRKTTTVYVRRKRVGTDSEDRKLTNDTSNPSTAGELKVYYGGTSGIPVAVVRSNRVSVYQNTNFTFEAEILPAGQSLGVRLLYWVHGSSDLDRVFKQNRVTVNVGTSSSYVMYAYFTISNIIVSFTLKSPLYGRLHFDYDTFDSLIAKYPDGTDYWSGYWRRAKVIIQKNVDFSFDLALWRYVSHHTLPEHDTVASQNAIAHGSSSPNLRLGSLHEYHYDTVFNGPEDEDVVIYLCSHLLVHKPDGQNLESKPPQLLYDCNAPEQSQRS